MILNLCLSADAVLYFGKISKGFWVIQPNDFHIKICKGHNFIKNIDRDMVLVLCTLSDDALMCTKFCKYISQDFRTIKQTRFL